MQVSTNIPITNPRAYKNTQGLFYVIDGLLDVSLPIENRKNDVPVRVDTLPKTRPARSRQATITRNQSVSSRTQSTLDNGTKSSKHLFTVKPGGIAGYLASLSGIPSYVDIRAKTDVYVGLLPANALERLLEKRPIVLLTLAKRLISLLSPLGRGISRPSFDL
jgi:lysophospholipid hydrolase